MLDLEGKSWEKFVDFFRNEKGYDWTEQEIEYSRVEGDDNEFVSWLCKELESEQVKNRFLIDELAWWVKEQYDETPLIFERLTPFQRELEEKVKEHKKS